MKNVHLLVLQVSSPKFSRILGGKFHYSYVWEIPNGYKKSAIQLIKFMYLKEINDLYDIEKTKELCLQLEMQGLFNTLQRVQYLLEREKKNILKRCCEKMYTSTRFKTSMKLRNGKRKYVY